MNSQKPLPASEVAPAHVWAALAADAQAGAIRLMASLASHLLAQHPEPTRQELAPCHSDSPLPRSEPSISIAKP
jgi:hypothetical protein